MAFKRVANLFVGNFADGNKKNLGYELAGLDFSFEVTRSIYWFENKAKFTVYNCSKETANNIMTGGASVIFEGGHENTKVGLIYMGQIGYAYTQKKRLDRTTHLFCTGARGGEYRLARVGISFSFPKGTSIIDVLDRVSAYCNMAFKGRENVGDIYIDRPFPFSGAVDNLLKQINVLLNGYGAGCFIDNNEIIVYRLYGDTSEFNSARVTYEEGMLSCTRVRDESVNEINYRADLPYWTGYKTMTDVQRKASEEKIAADLAKKKELNSRDCIKFSSVLRCDLTPNTQATVIDEDEDINGTYVIERCIFSGNNFGGEFKVECEAFR